MIHEKILASSLVISLLASIFFMPNQVYAQSPLSYVTGFSHNIIDVGYSNGQIWALATNGTIGTTANNWIYEVNSTTLTIDALYNVTATVADGITSNALNGGATDLWCSPIYCYYTTVKTSGNSGSLVRVATITAGGDTKGDVSDALDLPSTTFTGTNVRLEGRYLTDGDVTQIFTSHASSSTTHRLTQFDGLSMTQSQALSDTISSSTVIGGIYFWAPTVSLWNAIGGLTQGTSNVAGNMWNLYTNVLQCDLSMTGTSTQSFANFMLYHGTSNNPYLGMTPSFTDYPNGLIGYMPYTNGTAIAFIEQKSSTGGACDEIPAMNIDMADFDLANVGARTALASEQAELIFIQESGASARISVMSWDGTTGTISGEPVVYNTNPSVSQSTGSAQFVIIPELELIMVAETGAGRRIVVLDYSSLAPEPPTPPSNTNLPPQSITDVVGGLLCTSGLIAPDACDPDTGKPTNTDPETNGSGLFLTWFLFLFTGGIMIGVSRKFTFSLTNIPAEFWLGLVVLIMGISWYLGWIPDLIFYAMIVGLAGLFAFGLYRQIARGGG